MTSIGELADLIEANSNWMTPGHVVFRLHLLLGGEDVQYLTGDLRNESSAEVGRGLHGLITVLTADRVIQMCLTAAQGGNQQSWNRSTVSAVTWARSTLRRISLPGGPVDADVENPDALWVDEVSGAWPNGASIVLHYPDSNVTLPAGTHQVSRAEREGLTALLPSLWEDLRFSGGLVSD